MRYAIVIGAMKAGTSSAFYYLSESPQYAPSKVKETHFFSDDRIYSPRGYDAYWKGVSDSVRLEASPAYAFPENCEKVAARIAKDLTADDVRFIFLARDPIARVESHVRHHLSTKRTTLSEPIQEHLMASSYWKCVEPFVETFGKEALVVVKSEDLDMNPLGVLNEIDEFLEVDIHPYTRGGVKRNTAATLALPDWLQRMRWSRTGQQLQRVVGPRVRAKIRDAVAAQPERVAMNDRAIRAQLQVDLDRFTAEFNLDTTAWSRWNSAGDPQSQYG